MGAWCCFPGNGIYLHTPSTQVLEAAIYLEKNDKPLGLIYCHHFDINSFGEAKVNSERGLSPQ